MANKYSKYQITPYVSQYVDPQSVKVNELLRDRYDKNKASKDLIDRTLGSLEVMEGDEAIVEGVKKDVRTMLKSVIEQGDYENSSLVIQDAANLVETDKALQTAIKSQKNRELELQFQREARMKGMQILDFGREASKNHVSYYYDKESDQFISNVYEPMSEQQLDYDAEMRDLLVTIKADQKGNWEGITQGKADRIASMMLDHYLLSDAGKQDYKRLTQLELPQDIPEVERQRLAKKDILNRLRGMTRQYVYDKYTATKGGGGVNGANQGIMASGTTTTKGIGTSDNVYTSAAKSIDLLKNGDKNDLDLAEQIRYQQELLDDSVHTYLTEKGDNKTLQEWKNLKGQFTTEDDAKYFELVRLLTTQTYEMDTSIGQAFSTGASRGLQGMAAGATIGAGVGAGFGTATLPVVGTGVGWVGGAGIGGVGGGVGGFIFGVGESFANDLSKFRNVRDWHRGGGDDSETWAEKAWNLFADTEEEQLMEELFGGDEGDANDVTKINELLGTNYTADDVKELKEKAIAVHQFMISEKDGKTSGDEIMKHINDNGMALDHSGYTTDLSSEGNKIQANLDKGIRRMDPKKDFIILGNTTEKEIDDWLYDEKGKYLWDKAEITDVYEADPVTNTPLRIQIKIGDQSRLVQLKEGANGDAHVDGGFVKSLVTEFGVQNLQSQEQIRRFLKKEEQRTGQKTTIGRYFEIQAYEQTMNAGGTKEDMISLQRQMEDGVMLMYLLNPENGAPNIQFDNNQRAYYIKDGKALPFQLENGGYNWSVWEKYNTDHGKAMQAVRKDLMTQSLAQWRYRM